MRLILGPDEIEFDLYPHDTNMPNWLRFQQTISFEIDDDLPFLLIVQVRDLLSKIFLKTSTLIGLTLVFVMLLLSNSIRLLFAIVNITMILNAAR